MLQDSRWPVILYILTGVLSVSTIYFAVFLIEIPDSMTIIMCALLAVFGILSFLYTCRNLKTRIALVLFGFSAMTISVMGNYCNPYWNSTSFRRTTLPASLSADALLGTEAAKEDLEYVMHYLKKLHPAFYEKIPTEVAAEYENMLKQLENQTSVSVCELTRMAESVVAVLRDSHSQVRRSEETMHYLKDMYKFKDLMAVNGIKMEDLMRQTENLYSYEMDQWHLRRLKFDCLSLEGLQYLGFRPENGITYTIERDDGKQIEMIYCAEDFLPGNGSAAGSETNLQAGTAEANQGTKKSFVSYEIINDYNTAVLKLDSCQNNEEYKSCLRNMFAEVKRREISNVAVDLRNNTGGNSGVIHEFIRYLDVDLYNISKTQWRLGWFMKTAESGIAENDRYEDLTFRGRVYILTSSSTFSSAMLFAEYIQDNNLGLLIGEAPGEPPDSYGDTVSFILPNSKLVLTVSTKKFFRVDQNRPGDILEPDIPCDGQAAMEMLYGTIWLEEWMREATVEEAK